MRALYEAQLQPTCAEARLLDAFARRFQAVSLRAIDDAPPLRDLVVTGVDKTDTPLGNQPLDQLPRLRLSSACDGPLAVRRQAALSARNPALPSPFRRRHRFGGHSVNTDVRDRRVVWMMSMPKVEPSSLSDLDTYVTATAADRQQPAITQGMSRAPFTRRPGSGLLSGREPFEKHAFPFVQDRPPMHEHQPTPHPHTLHRAERVTADGGSLLGLFWDFRPHQQA
ncbi:hypothetical protein G3I56_29275 [Streptomyces sp. SID12488]|nr:hypothetical protein [Streptomyces sp. SID12488]